MVDAEIIDQPLLQGYLDNLSQDVIEKMLTMYIQQSEIYMQDIESTLVEGDQDLWQQRTHKMKGAAGSVGLKQVHKHLVSIEKSTAPSDDKHQYVAQLKELNGIGITTFKQWLATV